MNKYEKEELLSDFQCDYNRSLEENFAQTFSERDDVRLFFINENEAFTDGRNIIVDPAADELYDDKKALKRTEEYLRWTPCVSNDSWNALRMITRAQNIHECLHLLYTNFPPASSRDPKCDSENKKKAMSLIANIIEDAYIEAVGSSIYDNIELYLKFGRVSRLFLTHDSEGTAEKVFKRTKGLVEDKVTDPIKSGIALIEFLDYMTTMLLYPMVILGKPQEYLTEYVNKTKQLFMDGSIAESYDERYRYASKIFDLIMPLIPDDEKANVPDTSELIGGGKTHLATFSVMGQIERKGKAQKVSTRLFVDLNGKQKDLKNDNEKLFILMESWGKDKENAYYILLYTGYDEQIDGSIYDCSQLHKGFKVNQKHPKINMKMKKAYQNIKAKYQININSYNGRFEKLLKAKVTMQDDGYIFGSGIVSKRLGDNKKRYWYRNISGVDIPEISIMILIDGSGSMEGPRRNAALYSSVILHEVLKKQGIKHAIVEHRAIYDEPEIDANILVDFNGKDEQKYNLMLLDAEDNTRDGLALYWAEKYINQHTSSDNKLIIVISDGYPEHAYDEYYPPVSSQDTANAVKKITNRGTNIIGVALNNEESFDCYEALKKIYPDLVSCDNLDKLCGQLLKIISKQLM